MTMTQDTKQILSILPDRETRIITSSSVDHPRLRKQIWSFNSPMDFIFHTSEDDLEPQVIIEFSQAILNETIFLFNRCGDKDVAGRLKGVLLHVSYDGDEWLDVDMNLSEEQIYSGKPIPIRCQGWVRYLRLSRKGKGAPIHLSQITLGETVESLSTSLTAKLADSYNMELGEHGYIKEHDTFPNEWMRVLSSQRFLGDEFVINSLRLKNLGRFSNALIQMSNALHIALKLNVKTIYIPHVQRFKQMFPNMEQVEAQDFDITFKIGEPDPNDTFLEGAFFYSERHQELFAGSLPQYKLLQSIKHGLNFQYNESPFNRNELVIHLRAGDIFSSGTVHSGYGQPPLSFYKMVIKHENPACIYLVFEDKSNPVIEPLEKYIAHQKIQYIVSSSSLRDDIAVLLKARTLVAGRGTFIPGVVALSNNIETIYNFNSKIANMGRTDIKNCLVSDVNKVYRDSILSNNWTNSPEQRELMLTYPETALAFSITKGAQS